MRRRRSEGVVYGEVLVLLMTLLTIFTGILQFGFIAAAGLAVRHAAALAARAAIVVLDDHPDYYQAAKRNELSTAGGGVGPTVWQRVAPFAQRAGLSGGSAPFPGANTTPFNTRMSDVRLAASFALAPLAPTVGRIPRVVVGLAAWNPSVLAVSFPANPEAGGSGASASKTSFRRDELVTARVSYLYPCVIPVARLFICRTLSSVRGADSGQLGRIRRDIENFAEHPFSGAGYSAVVGILGLRVIPLTAEATLPNQGALYSAYPPLGA